MKAQTITQIETKRAALKDLALNGRIVQLRKATGLLLASGTLRLMRDDGLTEFKIEGRYFFASQISHIEELDDTISLYMGSALARNGGAFWRNQ